MKKLNLKEVKEFVNLHIAYFHQNKIKSLTTLDFKSILRKKNPYLFKAKNITLASDFIQGLLEAYLSSSEEKLFGDFLEELAIFIAQKTVHGRKSAATGIDLEFSNKNTHYLISIKSGPNWGNSGQQNKQEEDFKTALKVLKQSKHMMDVQPVLGICYGKTKTSIVRGYLKVVGQNFWYFISNNENLYIDIIEPLGYKAKKHNDKFKKEKSRIMNLFTQQFLKEFCNNGNINWKQLVEFNSGNLDLNRQD